MDLFEIELKVFLLKDIRQDAALEEIAALIDKSFLITDESKEFHHKKNFKNYVFNSFFPLEKDNYKAGKVYTVKIRTINEKLVDFFKKNLPGTRTDEIQSLMLEVKQFKQKHLTKIYSITPAIFKTESGYWKNKNSLETLENQIKTNAVRKFNQAFNQNIGTDFDLFKNIEIKNEKPVPARYKSVKLLGDKFELELEDSEQAQNMGYIMLGCGMLEMNARGYGFVNAKFV